MSSQGSPSSSSPRSPAVSVLIPTYNRAPFLMESVRSVLQQTFRDFELIVVDDGSTDGSADLLGDIDDERLRVLHRDHEGCNAALNAGLAVARGRYVARNDSDDVWLPHLLTTLVPILEAHADVGLVYGRCAGMRADGAPSTATRGSPLRYPEDPFRSLLYADYTAAVASVYRRRCLDRVGVYDSNADVHSDWDLALRVARQFGVRFVDSVVAKIREHPGNWTSLQSPGVRRRIETRIRVIDKALGGRSLSERERRMRAIALRNIYIGNVLQWLSIGAHRDARRSLAAALRIGNPACTVARVLWCALVWFGINRNASTARIAYALLRRARGSSSCSASQVPTATGVVRRS